ncbi:hypothetical protein [Nannocystis radixulma]|uniref:Uncharacterized protein n=1 Tax=Nannocystis radixulma TaxID=2995305 RepID=A0ABT5BDQ4_9BACT|nr:hypothetical protein [Nannocystis radixulma]MDC0672279.1 hypothetical protein [Nannocystis radixulma]
MAKSKLSDKQVIAQAQKIEIVNNTAQTLVLHYYWNGGTYDTNDNSGMPPGGSQTIDLREYFIGEGDYVIPFVESASGAFSVDTVTDNLLVQAAYNGQTATIVVTDGPPQPQCRLQTS